MIRLVVADGGPQLNFELERGGQPLTLTGCSVQARLKQSDGSVVTAPMVVDDALLGRVSCWPGDFVGIAGDGVNGGPSGGQGGDPNGGGANQGNPIPGVFVAGRAALEIVVSSPSRSPIHSEEPIPVFVRTEYLEGPR